MIIKEAIILFCNVFNITINFDEVEGIDNGSTIHLLFYKNNELMFKKFIKKTTIETYWTIQEGIWCDYFIGPRTPVNKLTELDSLPTFEPSVIY